MIKEIEDLKDLHELLGAFLRRDDEPVPGSLAQRLSAEDLEVIGKVGLVMKGALGAEPMKPNQFETALDLLKALVRDLSAFDSDDPISGANLVDYMANFYLLAKCHVLATVLAVGQDCKSQALNWTEAYIDNLLPLGAIQEVTVRTPATKLVTVEGSASVGQETVSD